MTTALVSSFLFLHGLVHLPVWLAQPGRNEPFDPRHSWAFTAAGLSRGRPMGAAAVGLASATAMLYVIAGAATAAQSTGWAVAGPHRGLRRPAAQGPLVQPLAVPRCTARRRCHRRGPAELARIAVLNRTFGEAVMTELTADKGIVVGIDGSAASMAALRWATDQAHALHAEVVAVHAWEPTGPGFAPYAPASARPTVAEQREDAARLLSETLREVYGPRIDKAVRAVLLEGPPARVLPRAARGALLLALGRTAHGQGDLPAIGTVGRECLRHATVPVVAVPVTERPVSSLRAVRSGSAPGRGVA